MSARPWTFAISSPRLTTAGRVAGVRTTDRGADYDVAYLADHTSYVDPLPPLVTMVEATTRLRFGTLVLNIGFWHPLLIDHGATTLQALTDGRCQRLRSASRVDP